MDSINKELFSIITTPSGNYYYYTAQQILSPLDSTLKYILENYLINGEIDNEKCKKDPLFKKLGAKKIEYYFKKIALWKDNVFFLYNPQMKWILSCSVKQILKIVSLVQIILAWKLPKNVI